jgi:hypothetical protein
MPREEEKVQIDGSWIYGFMVGFEFVRDDDDKSSHFVLDLFILRILLSVWD